MLAAGMEVKGNVEGLDFKVYHDQLLSTVYFKDKNNRPLA